MSSPEAPPRGAALLSMPAVYRRMFESVRLHRNFRLFFAGQVVSQMGSWVQKIAQVWFVLNLSHSGSALGILVVCQFVPYTAFGLFGGAICDRLDHYRALIVSQTVMMLCATALTVLAFGGSLVVWEVDVLAIMQGAVMIVDTPVRQAFVIQMVGKAQLPNAIALNVSVFNLARMVGPTLGGLAIAALGVRLCFLVNAVSFVAVLLGLLLMRRGELHPRARTGGGARIGELLRDTGQALRFAWRSPQLRVIMAIILVTATLGTSFNVTLPLLAQNMLHGSAVSLGLLLGCYGAGALAGALGMAALSRTSRSALLWSCGVMGALELVLALQHSEYGAGVVMVCIGVVMSSVTSNASATLQLDVSDHVRVRMLSLYSYGWVGTSPLSGLLAGWLSDSGGPGLAFAVGGGAMVLVAALGFGANRLARRDPGLDPGSGTDGQEGDRAVHGGLDPGNARG